MSKEPIISWILASPVLKNQNHHKYLRLICTGCDINKKWRSTTYLRLCAQEGRLERWEVDSCGDCWVSDGCLADSNDGPPPFEAHMYRLWYKQKKWWFQHRSVINNLSLWIMFSFKIVGPGFIHSTRHLLMIFFASLYHEKHHYIFLQYDIFL